MVCELRFHRWGATDRPVCPAEIVPSEIQGESGPQVRSLLRETVGEAIPPANLHPHRKILPLDM